MKNQENGFKIFKCELGSCMVIYIFMACHATNGHTLTRIMRWTIRDATIFPANIRINCVTPWCTFTIRVTTVILGINQ